MFYCFAVCAVKHCPGRVLVNGTLLSGTESNLSEEGSHKNGLQVMSSMDKFINLIYSLSVPPCTFALLLLMGTVELGFLPENEQYLDAIVLGNICQMTLHCNGLQGPNLLHSGIDGTLALPKGRKVLGKRSLVVGRSHSVTTTQGGKTNSR